jgi:hypothetical protein
MRLDDGRAKARQKLFSNWLRKNDNYTLYEINIEIEEDVIYCGVVTRLTYLTMPFLKVNSLQRRKIYSLKNFNSSKFSAFISAVLYADF